MESYAGGYLGLQGRRGGPREENVQKKSVGSRMEDCRDGPGNRGGK